MGMSNEYYKKSSNMYAKYYLEFGVLCFVRKGNFYNYFKIISKQIRYYAVHQPTAQVRKGIYIIRKSRLYNMEKIN